MSLTTASTSLSSSMSSSSSSSLTAKTTESKIILSKTALSKKRHCPDSDSDSSSTTVTNLTTTKTTTAETATTTTKLTKCYVSRLNTEYVEVEFHCSKKYGCQHYVSYYIEDEEKGEKLDLNDLSDHHFRCSKCVHERRSCEECQNHLCNYKSRVDEDYVAPMHCNEMKIPDDVWLAFEKVREYMEERIEWAQERDYQEQSAHKQYTCTMEEAVGPCGGLQCGLSCVPVIFPSMLKMFKDLIDVEINRIQDHITWSQCDFTLSEYRQRLAKECGESNMYAFDETYRRRRHGPKYGIESIVEGITDLKNLLTCLDAKKDDQDLE